MSRSVQREHHHFQRRVLGQEAVQGQGLVAVGAEAQALFAGLEGDAVIEQEEIDFLRRAGIEVQADHRMLVGGAAQHAAHQPGTEVGKELHGLQCHLAQMTQGEGLAVGAKDALVGDQRQLDFGIAGHVAGVHCAQAFGRLALGGVEVAAAALQQDARRLLGETFAHLPLAAVAGSAHGSVPWLCLFCPLRTVPR